MIALQILIGLAILAMLGWLVWKIYRMLTWRHPALRDLYCENCQIVTEQWLIGATYGKDNKTLETEMYNCRNCGCVRHIQKIS